MVTVFGPAVLRVELDGMVDDKYALPVSPLEPSATHDER